MFYIILKEKFNIKKAYTIYNAYKIIKSQNFFDEEYYLKKYPEVQDSKISPLNHYIYHGYKEKKQPSENFDGNYYLERYKDVKKSSTNPLIHYILHGQKEGRCPNKKTENEKFQKYLSKLDNMDKESLKPFLIKFSRELKISKANNSLDSSLFQPHQWETLQNILKDYNAFYIRNYVPEDKYPEFLEEWYFNKTGKELDLKNPKTFNEKIQWLKLFDSTPIKTKLSDKYLVRDWIKEKIGDKYLIPLLGAYNDFDEIEFNKLPDKFVIKANHGTQMNIIVENKEELDKKLAKNKIDTWLNMNQAFIAGLELHYSDIKPKILIEKYIAKEDQALKEYKISCFDGKPGVIRVEYDKQNDHRLNICDIDYNLLPVKVHPINKVIHNFKDEKPKTFDKMLELAKILSEGFCYVRVDFYSVDDKIYFGEMTFTPGSGTTVISPEEFHRKLGDLIKLPNSTD
ncbi:MAG: hypothetical protein FWH29_02275 [Methanobrevibacter sp.]|nr:hypothetical protein [Methanobrevibacter sp.]